MLLWSHNGTQQWLLTFKCKMLCFLYAALYHTFFLLFFPSFIQIHYWLTHKKEQTFQNPAPSKTLEVAVPTFTHLMAPADCGFLVTHQNVPQLDRILELQHILSKCASKLCFGNVLAPCEEQLLGFQTGKA